MSGLGASPSGFGGQAEGAQHEIGRGPGIGAVRDKTGLEETIRLLKVALAIEVPCPDPHRDRGPEEGKDVSHAQGLSVDGLGEAIAHHHHLHRVAWRRGLTAPTGQSLGVAAGRPLAERRIARALIVGTFRGDGRTQSQGHIERRPFVGDQVPVHVATDEQGAIFIAGMRQGRHIPCVNRTRAGKGTGKSELDQSAIVGVDAGAFQFGNTAHKGRPRHVVGEHAFQAGRAPRPE